MLEESVIVQDWIERGLQKGLQQGLHRGEAHIVLLLAEKLFGKISVKTRKQIENLPIKKIESLSKAMLDFESKKELTDWLAKHGK